ncbi:hypothetical protein CAJAP_01565 [Camponotus japonicus]
MPREGESLLRAQYELLGRIARAYENLRKSGAAHMTIGLVEARLHALDSNWSKFENNHGKLMAGYWEAFEKHEYFREDFLATVEETYLDQKGAFLEELRKAKAAVLEVTPAAAPLDASLSSSTHRTTLPRIQLPPFSGLYQDWPSFRDIFNSIIGQDSVISPVEKLHYLRTCLKGEAALLIGDLPVTGENFARAWTELTRHYENKRLLVRSYLARFSSLPALKGESASDLRKLLHGVINTVSSLEGIGRPITNSEDYFVHSIVERLDSRSRREWEHSIKGTTEPPSYSRSLHWRTVQLDTLQLPTVLLDT